MIKRTQGGREWIDAQASMIETLTASEALPLDDPGQATLTGRLQAFALLAVAASVESAGGMAESGAGDIALALGDVGQALAKR